MYNEEMISILLFFSLHTHAQQIIFDRTNIKMVNDKCQVGNVVGDFKNSPCELLYAKKDGAVSTTTTTGNGTQK